MQILFKQDTVHPYTLEMDLSSVSLKEAIEKTRQALDTAYAGFNNATDFDMIDSYIYEINALQRRYRHLTDLAEKDESPVSGNTSRKHAPVRTWITHIFR